VTRPVTVTDRTALGQVLRTQPTGHDGKTAYVRAGGGTRTAVKTGHTPPLLCGG